MSHSPNSSSRPTAPAKTPRPFRTAEVCALLAGGANTAAEAVTLIERHLSKRMAHWLFQHFPELSVEEREDVWGDVLLAVWSAARNGQYQGSKLFGWLCQLLRCRAITRIRKRAFDDRKEGLARDLARAKLVPPSHSPAEISAALTAIERAISTLTERQQAVVRAFVDHYPESRKTAVLRPLASRLAGRELTSASVRRALQDARSALRANLRQQGLLLPSLDGP